MARLLFFGKLGDLAGGRTREFPLPANITTINELIATIMNKDAVLGSAISEVSVRFVVNEKVKSNDATITNQDEIAFLPPVSGG